MSEERQVVRDDAGEVAAVYCGQPPDQITDTAGGDSSVG
jgi:hypothetical protein